MRVAAHTSKVGYHEMKIPIGHQSRYRSGGSWSDWFDENLQNRLLAVSNKSDTIKSDGIRPTPYVRKVGRIFSSSWFQGTGTHEKRGPDSAVVITLVGRPHGSSYSTPPVNLPSWMTDKVIQQCMEDLMDKRANILEDLGQAKKTLSQLVSIFNTIVKFYTMIRKGQWRKLRRALRGVGRRPAKKVSNAWLGWYYGIKPLISTFDALCGSYNDTNRLISAKRKLSHAVDPNGFASGLDCKVTGMAEQRVKCELTVAMKASADFRYWSSLGITGDYASDALVTVWALVPYTFVIDWILPVERFLRTRRFVSTVDYQFGYLSKSLVCDATATADVVGIGLGSKSKPGAVAQVKCMQFQRTVHNYSPPSGLSINQSLNPINLVNAAALIIQRR